MTIRFELRTTKKAKGAETVPLHISVSDGRAFRQRQVTNIVVNPEHWDAKAGDLKKRVLIKEEVRRELIEDLAALKAYINKKYTDDKEAGKVKDNWLEKDPNLVSALTGHVEGSRAFSRYRAIDMDMKMDLVKILEGKQ